MRIQLLCHCWLALFIVGCAEPDKQPEAPVSKAPPMSDAEKPPFTATSSGLKYRVLRNGSGKKPTAASSVQVHYKGWLDDGTEFDSSYGGQPISFPLRGVIAGWTEGLQLVDEGGMIELEIPSDLGYGPRGYPPVIPGGATLHFEVELLKVQ